MGDYITQSTSEYPEKMGTVSRAEAIDCVRKLIEYIGDDPNREGLLETPERTIKSYDEIFRCYKLDPKEILHKRFKTQSQEIVVLTNIDLYSTCEHHMLPFHGKCHIGYLPNGSVIGVSKMARLMDVFARRLQIQEELTLQIADALDRELSPKGVAVLIEAQHLCMSCRGVNQQKTSMLTSAMLGAFGSDTNLKDEFLRMVNQLSTSETTARN